MANARETKGLGERTVSHNPEVREIFPSSGWTEDSNADFLLLRLPDFKTEEVKLDVDRFGRLTVSGERLETVTGHDDKFKIFMFEQTFPLPQNSDIDQIFGKVEGDILRITVPKKPLEDRILNSNTEKIIGHQNVSHITKENCEQETMEYVENKHGDDDRDHGGVGEGGYGREMDKKGKRNSQIDNFPRDVIVVMAMLALLLAIVYRVFGSTGQDEGV